VCWALHELQAAELSPGPGAQWDLVLQLVPYGAAGATCSWGWKWVDRETEMWS